MASGTRERIVEAGIHLFEQCGFTQVGLDQVLQRAGVTKTTFYNHFDGREDLVRSVIAERFDEVSRAIAEAIARHGGTSPRERLMAVFEALIDWCENCPNSRCLLLAAAFEFPTEQDPTHQLICQFRRQRLAEYRQLAVEADIPNAELFATQLFMLIDSAIISRQVDKNNDAGKMAKQIARMLLAPAGCEG